MIDLFESLLIILSLALFEVITSIDNAVINADILAKMSERARKWFLVWGILIAVFVIRGLLPGLILWIANPHLGMDAIINTLLSGDSTMTEALEKTGPGLLIAGGVFLVCLFFHWIFLEPKHFGLYGEEFLHSQGVWFYAVVSILLTIIVWNAIWINPLLAFGAVVGSTAFFIVHGFKENAEKYEKELLNVKSDISDISKLMYLEVIDATFSIDGVIGAFAFTFFVPFILIGNGIGALVVRQLTIKNIENVKKYIYLKNGAMYSILFLGTFMILESFGYEIPNWLSPVTTFAVIGFFFWKSHAHLNMQSM